jgi:bacterial/archaeal transporter family protein
LTQWLIASLISSFFLGIYELFKKAAVQDNAVFPVIFFSNVASAAVWLAIMAAGHFLPGKLPAMFIVPSLTQSQHGLIFLKAAIVSASWICVYFALRNLPVTITTPISATGPIWAVMGGVLLMGERPAPLQWAGIATTLASFVGLSVAGSHEGIHFARNKWIWWMIVGTVFNSISAVYDKYLLGHLGFAASTVQAWYSIYLVVIFLPLTLGWMLHWWPRGEFIWRWSIPLVGLSLLLADFIYFDALRNPNALISVVSSIRRGSVLIAFVGGILLFKETNARQKLPAVIGIFAGILLTLLSGK